MSTAYKQCAKAMRRRIAKSRIVHMRLACARTDGTYARTNDPTAAHTPSQDRYAHERAKHL